MATEARIAELIESERTAALLAQHYTRVVERITRQLAAGISHVGSARVTALLREINAQIALLDPLKQSRVRRLIRDIIPRAYVLGDKTATAALRAELKSLGAGASDLKAISRTWTTVNQTAMRGVVLGTDTTLGGTAAEMRRRLHLVVLDTQQTLLSEAAINNPVVSGIIRGETGRAIADDLAVSLLGDKIPPDVKRRLRLHGFSGDMFDEFEAIARGQMIKVGGRNFSVRAYANLVAHNKMREAVSVGTIVRLQQNHVDHVRMSQHNQIEADECTPFAGRVFYIGEGEDPAGFPPLSQVPNSKTPLHPFCKHILRPYVVPLRDASEVEEELADSKILPKRFLGKDAATVRKLVKELPAKDLKRVAPKGFGDITRKEAA